MREGASAAKRWRMRWCRGGTRWWGEGARGARSEVGRTRVWIDEKGQEDVELRGNADGDRATEKEKISGVMRGRHKRRKRERQGKGGRWGDRNRSDKVMGRE